MKKLFFAVTLAVISLLSLPSAGDCQSAFDYGHRDFYPLSSEYSMLNARLISVHIATGKVYSDNGITFQDAYKRALKRASLKEEKFEIIRCFFVVRPNQPTDGVLWFIIREKQ